MYNKIIITGANGFLGTSLTKYLSAKTKEIVLLARHNVPITQKNIRWVPWDGENLDKWTSELEGADALINLAGHSVDCRYTEKNKKAIYDSRLLSTNILGKALKQCLKPPLVWINASSATIYKASFDKLMTEDNGDIGSDFSMDVCKKWEEAFNQHAAPRVRKVVIRTSIVLGRNGGALLPLRNLVKAGLGGKQGAGQQYFSWIHIRDFCRIVDWMITNNATSGIYNLASPNPVTNNMFMNALCKAMHVPMGINLPVWMLTIGAIFIRTQTELVLKSRKVYPKRLLDEGFIFEFPEVKIALNDLCQPKKTIS